MRQVKFAFCCDFLYFRSANIYSPKKGARCCNKSLTSSVLSFVVMYKRGVVMFGVVSLTMGNSGLPTRHRLPRDVQLLGKGLLRHAALLSDLLQLFAKGHFPVPPFLSVWLSYRPRRVFSTNLRLRFAFLPVRRATLTLHCPPEGRLGLFHSIP